MPISFEQRVAATGLHVAGEDLEKLRIMVAEIDSAAAEIRRERPYAEEPMNAFRLSPATP